MWELIVSVIAGIIVFLLFTYFVIFPVAFMCSIRFQRFLCFMNFDNPKNPEFNNFAKYDMKGVRNFYIDANPVENVKLGAWHILPESLIDESVNNPNFSYEDSLANSGIDTILHFHGVAAHRITNIPMFKVIRKYWHIVAFNYRDFADSTSAPLSEKAVVAEAVNVYKWLRQNTKSRVFVWGHSMGTALSTHTVAKLKYENLVPSGLILEAPFTSMREELKVHPLTKPLSYTCWFKATMLDTLEKNGFCFKSRENILHVDCPIMIVHAEDDNVLPIKFGQMLADIAANQRDPTYQGKVLFHQLPAHFKHGHIGIYSNPNLPSHIDEFLAVCLDYERNSG